MSEVTIEKHGSTTLFIIDRPHRRNALSLEVSLDLQRGLQEFDRSDQRVAVITGRGNEAFCAGADLDSIPELWRCMPGVGVKTEKPVIAAAAGWVIGGGLCIAMTCDLLVAAENSRFVYPEARIGRTGGMIASLVARIPHKPAMELMLLGRTMDAARAYSVGLASDVVPVGQQVEVAMRQAEEMAQYAPLVMRSVKRFANQVMPKGPADLATDVLDQLTQVRESADADEGRQAFKEKRPPRFMGQ